MGNLDIFAEFPVVAGFFVKGGDDICLQVM